VVEERGACESTSYFADWEDLAPYPGEAGPIGHVYASMRGVDVLLLPKTRGRTMVATHHRADRAHVDGDAERYYLDLCNSLPGAARRLAGARRVSRVIGIKKIANRYLQHAGPGWALVGDALHHKDPVDGQGIYDALIEAKLLAEAITRTLGGSSPERESMDWYGRRVHEETHPMFVATTNRLKTELYSEPPVPVIKTLLRWMLTDPVYQDRFLRLLCRDISPAGWLSPSLMAGSALRGMGRDLRRLFS
jgi:2-polyprenyl-6-methoxyphenol hydroxylase-like FAD-dependent oxidoreductase